MQNFIRRRMMSKDDATVEMMFPSLIRKEDLDIEEAETGNVASIEEKSKVTFAGLAAATQTRRPSPNKNRWQSMIEKVSERRQSMNQPQEQKRRRSSLKNNPAELLNAMRRKSDSFADLQENPLYQSIGLLDEISESDDENIERNNASEDVGGANDNQGDSSPLASSPLFYGSVQANEFQERFTRSVKKQQSFKHQVARKLRLCNCELFSSYIFHYIICSFVVLTAVPMFVLSIILYYGFGNPIVRFFNPTGTNITLSWWLNFWGRQIITFELARVTEWIIIDCIIFGTTLTKLLGPYVTLVALQARGFPFILAAWSIFDMFLLRGSSRFHIHWLYWTKFSIYSQGNSGAFILSSDLYFRVLLSMLLIGLATTMKRAIVAIRFGKRLLAEFKPRMEQLLADIVLMSEISILAEQVEAADNDYDRSSLAHDPLRKERESGGSSHSLQAHGSFITEEDIAWTNIGDKRGKEFDLLNQSSRGGLIGTLLLDHWEDPVQAIHSESQMSTIYDVLKFKRALGYMDEAYPFGESFGRAGDRDEAIKSAHKVFFQLTKVNEHDDDRLLNFDVIALITHDEDGVEISAKLQALKKLFRPDARNQLNLLAFVQSLDGLYKRLRFFRASVSNSSAIDAVLEGMINFVFVLILGLLVLSLLKFNPYTLLVSTTSLFVSFAFALGPSVSGFVEGLLLITGRRPYDLGDRIVIVGSESSEKPNPIESYFVEDIALMKTTVRYARTNEVSTINNFAISKSRIINYQRSLNATIYLELKFTISAVFQDDKHQKYQSLLEDYVHEHTRNWECLDFMRHDDFNADWGYVVFHFSFRHRSNWQNAARIMNHRAELLRFMHDKGVELGIHYITPLPKRTTYVDSGALLFIPERGMSNLVGSHPLNQLHHICSTCKEVSIYYHQFNDDVSNTDVAEQYECTYNYNLPSILCM